MTAKPLSQWDRNECLDWLNNEGILTCAMADELLDDELPIEVALQAEAMEVFIPGMSELLDLHEQAAMRMREWR